MKTTNFFLIHSYLVKRGYYKSANWLLRKVIVENRPSMIWHGLSNNEAWHISGIADGNGYNFKLTY